MNSFNYPFVQDQSTQLSQSQSPSSAISNGYKKIATDESEIPFPSIKFETDKASREEREGMKPWNEEEELNVIIAHYKYKNKWSEISNVLKGRNNNTIKNRFYSIFRRIKGKILKGDINYNTKLELFEILYILSLIEEYLDNSIAYPAVKGKRGKDFICSLVHNINRKTIKNYKELIQPLIKHEGTMEEILTQLINNGKCASVLKNSIAQAINFTGDSNILKEPALKEVPKGVNDETLVLRSFKGLELEGSVGLEMGFMSPMSLISSPAFSIGPGRVIARSYKAACFKDTGFSEVSTLANICLEEDEEILGYLEGNSEHVDSYKLPIVELQSNEYYQNLSFN